MDMQEWQGYVQKVAKSQYPVPEGMIKDYDDCRCLLPKRCALVNKDQ